MLNDLSPSIHSVTTRNNLVSDILNLQSLGYTWRQIGDHYGVTSGMVYRIALYDYEPVDSEIRQRLGLDAPILSSEILEARLAWVLDLCEVPHA